MIVVGSDNFPKQPTSPYGPSVYYPPAHLFPLQEMASMVLDDWQLMAMDVLDVGALFPPAHWLWDGYLMPGDITLLTSLWKTGKTTLLAGLLQSLGAGTPFLEGSLPRSVTPRYWQSLSASGTSYW